MIAHVLARHQLVEARHVIAHVAIGRDNDAGRPAHHVIAGEQCAALLQRKAKVVRGVARRGDCSQGPAGAAHAFAVEQHTVGRVGGVEGLVGARQVALEHERRTPDNRRAGLRCERRGGGRVVAVGVGAHDRHDLATRDGGDDRCDMRRLVRAGIDHRAVRPLRLAHHVSLGAGEGIGRGIGCQHAAHQRLDIFGKARGPGLGRDCDHGLAYEVSRGRSHARERITHVRYHPSARRRHHLDPRDAVCT